MVTTAIQFPPASTSTSTQPRNPMSPYNQKFGFYVYGTLPLYIVKIIGLWVKQAGYDEVTLLGRVALGAVRHADDPDGRC